MMVFVGCATVGILLWFWYRQASTEQTATPGKQMTPTRPATTGGNADRTSDSLVIVFPDGSGTARNSKPSAESRFGEISLGVYNESVRALMRSNSYVKIDYGSFQLRNVCRSFLNGQDGLLAVRGSSSLPQAHKADALVIGNATEAVRLAGFQRSLDKCTKLFEGATISEGERNAMVGLPAFVEYRAILDTLGNAKNFDAPETIAALSSAVSGPMFGALSPLLSSKVDYTQLINAYGKDQIDALRSLTIPLVLCRMGDDCGPGGTVTEQLCWENGICGNRVEEAIFANLRDRGLDTTAFSQFIFKVHQALQAGDTSIFRKQKPSK